VRFALKYEIVVLDRMLARWHVRNESASNPSDNSINAPMDLHRIWRARLVNDLVRGRWLGQNSHLSSIAVLGAKLNAIEEKIESLKPQIDGLKAQIDSPKAEIEHLRQTLQLDMEDIKRTTRDFSFFWQIRRGIGKRVRSLFTRAKRQ